MKKQQNNNNNNQNLNNKMISHLDIFYQLVFKIGLNYNSVKNS